MASRFGKLALDDSPRTLVFRAIDDHLRNDANLQRFFSRPGSFRSWRGVPEDKQDLAQSQAPAIRLTPIPGPESWWYPGSTKGDLIVRVELLVAGLAWDDVENLFHAIQRSLVPANHAAALVVHDKLRAAGAMTGLVLFTPPTPDTSEGGGCDGGFRTFGQLKLEIKAS